MALSPSGETNDTPAPELAPEGRRGPDWLQSEVGFAAVLLAVSVAAWRIAAPYPGLSGSYPRTLAVLLGIGAALVMLRALWRRGTLADRGWLFIHMPRALMGFALLAAYVVAIDFFGYLLPSLALGVAVPTLLGYRRPLTALAVTLATIVFIVLVFFVVLERPLPPDLLQPLLEVLR